MTVNNLNNNTGKDGDSTFKNTHLCKTSNYVCAKKNKTLI